MTRYSLQHDKLKLEVESLGARIMRLSYEGTEIMKTAKTDLQGYNGMVLAPWPNRIPDGKYSFQGEDYELEINELDRNNALHGFAFQREFELIEKTKNSLTLSADMFLADGYPFDVQLKITYLLTDEGFQCSVTATNNSEMVAPFGIAFHPYYPVTDETKISLPARQHILTNDRMIPTGEQPNQLKSFMFSEVDLDDCFLNLDREGDLANTHVESPGQILTLWQDQAFDFIMVYTTNEFDSISGPQKAIAIEAQSCEANAFNTNPPLLQPRESFTGGWGVSLAKS